MGKIALETLSLGFGFCTHCVGCYLNEEDAASNFTTQNTTHYVSD